MKYIKWWKKLYNRFLVPKEEYKVLYLPLILAIGVTVLLKLGLLTKTNNSRIIIGIMLTPGFISVVELHKYLLSSFTDNINTIIEDTDTLPITLSVIGSVLAVMSIAFFMSASKNTSVEYNSILLKGFGSYIFILASTSVAKCYYYEFKQKNLKPENVTKNKIIKSIKTLYTELPKIDLVFLCVLILADIILLLGLVYQGLFAPPSYFGPIIIAGIIGLLDLLILAPKTTIINKIYSGGDTE